MDKFNKLLWATILAVGGHPVIASPHAVAITSDTKQKTAYWMINPEKCSLGSMQDIVQSSKTEHSKKTHMGVCAERTAGIPDMQFTEKKGDQFMAPNGFVVVGHNVNGWAACEAQPGLRFYTANKADRKILKGGELACGK